MKDYITRNIIAPLNYALQGGTFTKERVVGAMNYCFQSEDMNAMNELGDYAVGVFYWEPAWIDVPGANENEKNEKREKYGAGWASSYAGAYDPEDAGKYYGATSCIYTSLFDEEGHPLESLRTFLFVKYGTK